MTTIPNDDFDMCCGNRPHVQKTTHYLNFRANGYEARCGICGDVSYVIGELWQLMIDWNGKQREKA